MAGTNYNRLFNLRLVHTFYEKGVCARDFNILPTTETLKTLTDLKMLFKPDEQGFRVYYKTSDLNSNDLGAPLINASNTDLLFKLSLENKTSFLNFTNANAGANVYNSNKIAYFSNKSAPTNFNLAYSLIDFVKPKIFTYLSPTGIYDTGLGLDITVLDPNGNTILNNVYFSNPPTNSGQAAGSYSIDFSNYPVGLYTFTTSDGASEEITEKIFISNELVTQSVFGLIHINVAAINSGSFPAIPGVGSQPASPIPAIASTRVYDAKFISRNTQWKYIVVLKSDSFTLTSNIVILDEGGSQSPYNIDALEFDTLGSSIVVNGKDAKIITSVRTDIPYFEVPKKQLRLVLNPGLSRTVILDNIPGPSYSFVSSALDNTDISEIFIYI